MAQELKLHGVWASPFSHRIELALKLKGLHYEYFEEDLSNKSPLLLKYNPVHKKIPVLVHKGKPIAESLVILEYIDETWPINPLLPQDPHDRATARFWAKFVDDKILQTALKATAGKGEEEAQLIEEAIQQLKLLENELKEKEFFGGATIGYLDIAAIYIVYWFHVRQEAARVEFFTDEKFPVLYKWFKKLLAIELVKDCLPPREKHVAFMAARIETAKLASK